MLKLSRYHKIVDCLDSSLELIYYTYSSLKGVRYIQEVQDLNNVYINAFLLNHHLDNPPSLEDIATLYSGKFYQPGQ